MTISARVGLNEAPVIPHIGAYSGHVLSTALLVVAILVVSFGYFRWTTIEYRYVELVLVGLRWTVLTLLLSPLLFGWQLAT